MPLKYKALGISRLDRLNAYGLAGKVSDFLKLNVSPGGILHVISKKKMTLFLDIMLEIFFFFNILVVLQTK